MSKTKNYQLTLWDYDDEDFGPGTLRADLRDNFTAIDEAIKAEETARVKATPRVVVGTYTGGVSYNTGTVQSVRLGFRPKAVYLMAQEGNGEYSALLLEGHPARYGEDWFGQITASGFEVRNVSYRYLNYEGKVYHYWAIV